SGLSREEAYRIVQAHAMRAWEEEGDFRAAVTQDPMIRRHLDETQLEQTFSLQRQLENVDAIFERVFHQ
ncbi:MAG: adenylosuccinate lyase, partial [Acidobacteriaceae bacterium]|nr:adenylosuccinate lyase [Acidobacteriaceae bacterium]